MRIFVDRLASRGIAARSLAAATMAIAGLGFLMASPAVAQLPPPLAAVEPLGAGTTGAAGVPELKVLGYEALDQPGAGLRLFHGAPLAPAQIVLSLAIGPTPLPGYGAQLWPAAPFTRWTTALDAQGVSPVFHSGPAPAPAALAGMDLIAQGLVVDAVAQGGAAFTAGVRVHVGAGTSAARLFPFAGVSLEGDGKSAVATGDVDGDGRPDIVTVAHELTDFSVRVLRQLSDGTFAPPLASPFPGKGIIKDMELADLTADGRLDAIIAVPTAVPSALVLLPGLGDGEFGAPQVITAPSAVPWIAAGD
ncbi:MAG TPA: VCBS repeat-containing protein, partial [Planctomycetota bacterium]|nr:VCBS repeat-containing protein [Planctomycetota bacterium]